MTTSPLPAAFDLAGICPIRPNYLQIRARINCLIDRYLSIDTLSNRLVDLPQQFSQPHQRHWEPIDLKAIHRSQIVGVDPDLFILVLAGAIEIEAPIRAYSQESWQYMQTVHPAMANFMGGELNPDGSVKAIGIWEKEERQHAPLFAKIYAQLTGEKAQPKPNSVVGYQAAETPWQAVYGHTLSRISTEWGAVSVYLWLMAHSTGALQQAIAQPLQDEVNHLAKFWGFSRWAFAGSFFAHLQGSSRSLLKLLKHHQGERSNGNMLVEKTQALQGLWHTIELGFTFARIMVRMRTWNRELSSSFLQCLFGPMPQH